MMIREIEYDDEYAIYFCICSSFMLIFLLHLEYLIVRRVFLLRWRISKFTLHHLGENFKASNLQSHEFPPCETSFAHQAFHECMDCCVYFL